MPHVHLYKLMYMYAVEEKPQRIYNSVVNPLSIHPVCGLRSAVWRKKLLLFLTSSALLVLIN